MYGNIEQPENGEQPARHEPPTVEARQLAAVAALPADKFVDDIAEIARKHFDCASYPAENMPADDWELLTRAGVLLPVVPREFGGRHSHVELCRVLEAIAEWNLPLAMYVKITTAVALRPIPLYASEETRREMLPEFASGKPITCGFASTEPGAGSGMSSMTTTFDRQDDTYVLRGRKHWQGFSATASWWLVSAKNDDDGREYGYFALRRDEGFRTVERYEPIGMKVLDYGVNEIEATVPAHRRLHAESGDLRSMVELLMPPRSMMAALATGFLRRVRREAHSYAASRPLGRGHLTDIGFVRYRLACIDTSYTICEALAHYLRTQLDIRGDMTATFPATQAIKTVATERMVSSANHYQQIVGGEGYRTGSPTNVAAQAFLDTRVFTIFDGTNDLLSQQLTQYCRRQLNGERLSEFLGRWPLTGEAVAHGADFGFLDGDLRQEQLVLAGRAIAYAFALTRVLHWAEQSSDEVAERARRAVCFLLADIRAVAGEFSLLDQQVVD
ncbi:acyl-CoA dehydrogenase family protein [Lentzea sp. NPDC059081]|uniref:acyl-CoA dehydrogenase family protein n=1 Tax=Lentzea sp. NPDC059081 TaxID=3346719 RepID=UPI0036B94398